MITGSVTPGISTRFIVEPSWQGCKEKLFKKSVEQTSPAVNAELEASHKINPRGFNEVCELINALNKAFPYSNRALFQEKYVLNLKNHFESHANDPAYIHELIKDFEFKAVKKLATNDEYYSRFERGPEFLKLELTEKAAAIYLDINKQLNEFYDKDTKCAAQVSDITYDSTDPSVRIKDRYGKDFWSRDLGHCLQLKNTSAPNVLQGDIDTPGPLGPNAMTAIISAKKLARLLTERKILVIGKDNQTGQRSIYVAALPDYYFSEIVESKHLYRGMENYPPLAFYDGRGKHMTVWYAKIGGDLSVII